jgi:hypothetical protein
MRRNKTDPKLRGKLNLTMHPEVREWADIIAFKRRRSISQLFEDLVEAEWNRQNQPQAPSPKPAPQHQAPMPVHPTTYFHPQQGGLPNPPSPYCNPPGY